DFEKTRPKTIKGKQKPLGVFEYEETYDKLITLGAKKYLVEVNGELHLTLAGVSKSGVKAIKKIEDFKKGFVFGYDDTGKKLLYYTENQPDLTVIDCNGKIGTLTGSSGICLTPCRYQLGITKEYFEYLETFENESETIHGLMNVTF
ncbi:MAG TPA: hypothetical protein PLR63_08835, partial [Paludibacteraceae bacterium]|nr:hypothetical protein [Paludibacteraceae bacterium]